MQDLELVEKEARPVGDERTEVLLATTFLLLLLLLLL